ncbi:hypothetical protein OIE66_40660 [Nonomuraea sp. NBC_01738]|uniref:hypothetical protein n=1 Tax=Nonomuraea sp. NBC_01738 TaxID=2976003 RepID=UPI002E146511|nr:hypothetical protein OIE66_40660 [Nonomuraea sp. NBC_01738]
MDLHLSIDGPHDDDTIREIAAGLSEAVHVLNYATRPDPIAPLTAYDVIGSVHETVDRLGQLLSQLRDGLHDHLASGRLGHDDGDPIAAVAAATERLAEAKLLAAALARRLGDAHRPTAGLHLLPADSPSVRGGPELDPATEDDYRTEQADYDGDGSSCR